MASMPSAWVVAALSFRNRRFHPSNITVDSNPNAFKHGLGKDAIRRIAKNIKTVDPNFSDRAFVRAATKGLDSLELKARVMHVAVTLRRYLPDDVRDAMGVLVKAGEHWDAGDPNNAMKGFAAWPVIEFVGEYGLPYFDESMEALRTLTSLFSAEFAIRVFLERYPKKTMKRLAVWSRDPDHHVRRLVSEGSRPRLPWGKRLKQFQEDPAPVLKVLEKLKDDESEYVRRSVANNLNDIAKDHPDLVMEVCRRWARKKSANRQWIIKHAMRTLVKAGNVAALDLLGFDPKAKIVVDSFTLTPKKIRMGEELCFSIEIHSKAKNTQPLVVDFAIHHVKKSGNRSAKVFKLRTVELGAKKSVAITKKYRFREISTRTYYSGRHGIEILINGQSHGMKEFELRV